MADVLMIDAGPVIGFRAETEEAQLWFDEFVENDPGKHGALIFVDHREAVCILDALYDGGLSVSV
jgi:hypothetical protein